MRTHPIVGFTLPRNVPDQGCEIAGHWIPGTAHIGVNPAVVHFDRSIFGDDADEFRPERWMGPDSAHMDQYILQVRMKLHREPHQQRKIETKAKTMYSSA
jgi:cytochrome P450